MNESMVNATPSMLGIGYLIVAVSTARGAIPLENASVNIRASEEKENALSYALLTDRDGKTEKLALPAPSVKLSQTPQNAPSSLPYARYRIDVSKEGYYRQIYENVAVFDGITAIQPAILIPLPETARTDSYSPGNEITFNSDSPDLSGGLS